MNTDNLTSYLKDHLAGSVAALGLLDHLTERFEGAGEASEMQQLKKEIESDQAVLKDLLERLAGGENPVKKAGAWLAEKMLRVKNNTGDGDLGTLEALEVLALGIEGKMRLWRALEPLDLGLGLQELQKAAARQGRQVETLRLQAARRAFA